MIRNLEKEVAKTEAGYNTMSTGEFVHAEIRVKNLRSMINRLENACRDALVDEEVEA